MKLDSKNQQPSQNAIGVNIGSVSVNVVGITNDGNISNYKQSHKGNPRSILTQMLETNFGENQHSYGISGTFGSITEVRAIERGIQEIPNQFDAVLSLGGETFLLYLLDENGHISNIISQDKCAAGSGEFFLQQIDRLNLSLNEAVEIAKTGSPIQIASRCSVHCKSDITHKLNKNEAKIEDILYSLLLNIANKAKSLIIQARKPLKKILVIGGLCYNNTFIEILKTTLNDSRLIIIEQSHVFEAFGTALLVQDNPTQDEINLHIEKTFSTLPSLKEFEFLVKIMKDNPNLESISLDTEYYLGIDVGSTTTKAVIMDPVSDDILASYYGRTNGNPIIATQNCIREIIKKIGNAKISLIGVTGSERSMVGAYIGTPAIYNEISAHSAGAAFYEPDLDTIFEIGGQDAKYMYLDNGVPIDYAMNASCSAGTGSFLEESARCDLGISVYDICDIALKSKEAVRYKADCAAFINSDIRTALQEGYSKSEIISGLVYSIANNYLNKVKGTRPIGHKIFLQGGVAKNHAVGYAFAQITGREIIIPPSPELIGAFGIALLAKEKLKNQEISLFPTTDLETIISQKLDSLGSFTCKACENFCIIERYQVGNRSFPFGGSCSRWENKRNQKSDDSERFDIVNYRNKVFYSHGINSNSEASFHKKVIGIPRALLTHSLYPLFATYFDKLGLKVILSDIEKDMALLPHASFCYPVQILHGAVANLTKQEVDFIFIPYINKLQKGDQWKDSTFCPITQASPYIISGIFTQIPILSPELDYSTSYIANRSLIEMAQEHLAISLEQCEDAYEKAVFAQELFEKQILDKGKEMLQQVIDSNEIGIIVVGRSYNVFPKETSQSIPKKMISMGMNVIPFECLPRPSKSHFPWYFANYVEEAVNLVKKHKNLFLLYINNFSCTIDAFIQNFVRSEMGSKPYLLLELDAHVADAGTQTRIEAFREIITNYRQKGIKKETDEFQLTRIVNEDGNISIVDSSGEKVSVRDKRVKLYVPCFSDIHTSILMKLLEHLGFNIGSSGDIKLDYAVEGLKYSSGKECIPLPIVIGHIMDIVKNRDPDEISGYFMIRGGEPCVVCDYDRYIEDVFVKNKIKNTFVFGFVKDNNYLGSSTLDFIQYSPKLVVLGDILVEILSSLEVVGKPGSIDLFNQYFREFLQNFTRLNDLNSHIDVLIKKLKTVPRNGHPNQYPRVILSGDFFVRYSPFFLKEMKSIYSSNQVIVKSSDLFEIYLYGIPFGSMVKPKLREHYCRKIQKRFRGEYKFWKDFSVPFALSQLIYKYMQRIEKKLRNRFEETDLLYAEGTDIMRIIEKSQKIINPLIFGEAVVTVGKAMEILEDRSYDSLILIGPQYCLPYRISQAILKPKFMENDFPIMVFDSEISPISPNMRRLIHTNIEQIKRNYDLTKLIASDKESEEEQIV